MQFLSHFKIPLLAFNFLLLSGCSTLFNSGFECNKVGGKKGCAPLSAIHQEAEDIAAENMKQQYQSEHKDKGNKKQSRPIPAFTGTSLSIPQVGMPVRIGDSIQKIMIFDYIDTDGNYHEPGFVYTVLSASKWQNHPVKAIQTMEDF